MYSYAVPGIGRTEANTMNMQTSANLRFLCLGTGAIGTYIGGSLAAAGQPVVFVDRPEMAALLKENGLHIRRKDDSLTVTDPDVVSSMEDALTHGPFDVGILAVKSYDTAGLLEMLAPYSLALPPILCLQNGVDNEPALQQVLGAERVIHGTVTTAVGRLDAGSVVVEKLRGMGVANEHLLASNLVAVLNSAGLHAQAFSFGAAMKWSKMFTNLVTNASSAILGMPPTEILADAGLYRLELAQLREALSVMRALGHTVVDLPGTPVRALAFIVRRFPAALSQPVLRQALGRGRGGKMPSFYLDLESGRGKSEVGFLNGAVVRYGAEVGVNTPVNQALTEILMDLTEGRLARADFLRRPAALINRVYGR